MIKADYNSIIYDYLAIEADIAEIDAQYSYGPAMEADNPSTTTTATTAATVAPTQGAKAQVTGTNDNGQKAAEINGKAAAQSAVKDKPNENNSVEQSCRLQ